MVLNVSDARLRRLNERKHGIQLKNYAINNFLSSKYIYKYIIRILFLVAITLKLHFREFVNAFTIWINVVLLLSSIKQQPMREERAAD